MPRCGALFAGDAQVAVHHRDGWEALGAFLPPPEKRALVLIDPPYETAGRARGRSRALWPPGVARFRTRRVRRLVSDQAPRAGASRCTRRCARRGLRDVVAAELWLREPLDAARLNGCGLVVVNPPWRFEQEAAPILAALLDRLGDGEPGAGFAVERIADE